MAAKARAQITLTVQIDIQSVWWYYKLQSSTAAMPAKPTANPPGGWTLTEPAYTEGSTNTLYFVELTVFSDGSFDYTDVSVDSSYEAAKVAYNKAHAAQDAADSANEKIDNLQVGGRNLYLGTREFSGDRWINLYPDIAGTYEGLSITRRKSAWNGACQDVQAKEGEIYTFSAFLKKDAAMTGKVRFYGTYRDSSAAEGVVTNNGAEILATTEWQRYMVTFKVTRDGLINPRFEKTTADTSACLYLCGLKLERGNLPTDWTPAPKDITERVDETTAQLNILKDSVNARVEKKTYDQDMTGLREQVSAQYTDFTQTAEDMKAEIGELQQDGDELRVYVRYGLENGVGTLSLGQTDSVYKAVINNTGFTIQQDGEDMTYARKNTLSAPVIEARRVYQQGNYTVKVQSDGGLMWN